MFALISNSFFKILFRMLHIGLPTWIGLRWNRNHFEWADKSEVTYIHPEYVPDSANGKLF